MLALNMVGIAFGRQARLPNGLLVSEILKITVSLAMAPPDDEAMKAALPGGQPFYC